jgi:hemerythrin-like domain-containing protein
MTSQVQPVTEDVQEGVQPETAEGEKRTRALTDKAMEFYEDRVKHEQEKLARAWQFTQNLLDNVLTSEDGKAYAVVERTYVADI